MTVEAALPAAVLVVGGDYVVGHALVLLLSGSGYAASFQALSAFDAKRACEEASLILLAPGLDEWDGNAVLSSIVTACYDGDLPVLELTSATTSRSRGGHSFVPWPCRTEDLERKIEAILRERLLRRQPTVREVKCT